MTSVSVVIPAYNAAQHIAQTIQSVQQQSFRDFEIIVVNDASEDETLAVLDALQEPRLRIISGEHKGVSAARNRGIAASCGEWIAFLDADDLWAPDKLQAQMAVGRDNPQIGLCYSWLYYWSCGETPEAEAKHLLCPRAEGAEAYRSLIERNVVGTGSNIMVRRTTIDAVGGFDETLTHGEDWEFCFRVALNGSVALIPEGLVYYRQHSESSCSNFDHVQSSTLRAIAKIFSQAPEDLQPLKSKVCAHLSFYLTNLYLTRTHSSEGLHSARQHWQDGLRQYPTALFAPEWMRLSLKLWLLSLLPLARSNAFLALSGR